MFDSDGECLNLELIFDFALNIIIKRYCKLGLYILTSLINPELETYSKSVNNIYYPIGNLITAFLFFSTSKVTTIDKYVQYF